MTGWRLLAIVAVLALCGCARTTYIPVETVRAETQIVRDTVVVAPVPSERTEAATRDTVSRLRTSLAVSEAEVRGGVLRHTLEQRGDVPVRVQYVETVHIDTVRVPYPLRVVEKEQRPLHWWQRALMWLGGIAAGGVVLAGARRFRR